MTLNHLNWGEREAVKGSDGSRLLSWLCKTMIEVPLGAAWVRFPTKSLE